MTTNPHHHQEHHKAGRSASVTNHRGSGGTGTHTTGTVAYHRLPKHVVPQKYIICIKPQSDDESFEGSEIIHITIKTEASEIVMNAVDITVGKIMWEEDVTENRQEPLEFSVDTENELLTIKFEPPLYPSDGTLRINFNGKIYSQGYKGIYRSNRIPSDLADDPNPEYYLLTNFKPSHARRCFPCWDEPSFKASFEMCFVVPTFYTALSNMPLKASFAHRSNVHLHMVECLNSPAMSTLGVGFCLGKFEYLWGKTRDNLPYRVHTERKKKKYGSYVTKLLTEFIPFFRDYYGCAFPLAKLDVLIVPDVCSEAVRNWGLITCRDTCLFVDEHSSKLHLQDICCLVAREVAHQWFGNLVTMDWYNYLWLNQGLAQFTAHMAVDNFAPQYQIWTQFICNICIPTLDDDCNRFSPAIESPVNNLNEFSDLKTCRTGKKGACLIRMLYNYIGSNDFKQGLFAYLDQYRHQSATSLDFFRVMEQVSGKPVVSVFNSWVKNPGYPLIRVSSKQEGNYRTFTVTQEKFCDNHAGSNDKDKEKRGSLGNKDSKDALWMIPVTFASATRENLHSVVLEKRTTTVTFLIGKAHWVTINPGHFGFFRVRYSQDCFAQLLSAVRQKMLPIFERMSLLSDLNAMASNGISSTVELLSVLEAYVEETHYSVWKVIVSVITRLDLLLDSTDYYKKFQAFVYFIFSRIAEKTNFEVKTDEEHLLSLRRNLIMSTMVRFRKQSVLTEAQNLFEKSQADGVGIPRSIRDPVYKAVLQDCDEDVIRTFFQMYRDAGLQGSLEEQGRICRSLGSVSDGEKVKLVLEFVIKEDVRDQHAGAILQSLAGNSSPEGREMAWNFFKEHWSLFRQRFVGSDLIPRLVKGLIENFATEEKAAEITDFFQDHHIAGTDRIVLLNCEKIRAQEAVFKKDTNFIQDHLSSYA